jgi:hypothetical protein
VDLVARYYPQIELPHFAFQNKMNLRRHGSSMPHTCKCFGKYTLTSFMFVWVFVLLPLVANTKLWPLNTHTHTLLSPWSSVLVRTRRYALCETLGHFIDLCFALSRRHEKIRTEEATHAPDDSLGNFSYVCAIA